MEDEYLTTPYAVSSGGGNTTIVNGNEMETLEYSYENTPVVYAPGGRIDYSYVTPMFKKSEPDGGSDY